MSVLEKAHVVARNCLDQRLCSRKLTESNSEVVRIVQGVEEIAVERVDIRKARESLDGGVEALGKGFGRVLDFSRVEGSNSADLETRTNLRRQSGNLSASRLFVRYVLRLQNRDSAGRQKEGALRECVWRRNLPPLGPGKYNIQELLARRHSGDVFPLSLHFGDCGMLLSWEAVCAIQNFRAKKFERLSIPPCGARPNSSPHQR